MADEGGVWRTISGRRVFIKDGQSLTEAMAESGKFGGEKSKADKAGLKIMADNYDRHREHDNLHLVPFSELKDDRNQKTILADYKRIPTDIAEEINAHLEKLTKEYNTPLSEIRSMNKEETLANMNAFMAASHNYEIDSARIVINPLKIKDAAERIQELSDKGYCVKVPKGKEVEYLITHEYGHAILDMREPLSEKRNWAKADYGRIKAARAEIGKIYEKYKAEVGGLMAQKKQYELDVIMGTGGVKVMEQNASKARALTKDIDRLKLSNYSLQNSDEFLAEAFAHAKVGSGDNEYSKQVMDVLDKHFRWR